jgi:glycosyltransferase involved in cell wall biosynthesis
MQQNDLEQQPPPILTIIVPVRNMENRLENLFSWVPTANQLGFQIITVCNGCTDKTKSEIDEFSLQNSLTNLTVLETTEIGPGKARRHGLDFARGEYTVFWDSDDIAYPEKILKILPKMKNCDALIAGYSMTNQKTNRSINSFKVERDNDWISFSRNPGIWRCVFKTSSIKELNFCTSLMGEDQVFISNFLSNNPEIKFTDDLIYNYFIYNPNQLTSNKKNMKDLVYSALEIAKLLNKTPQRYLQISTVFYLRICLTGIKKGDKEVKLKMTLQLIRFLFGNQVSSLSQRRKLFIVICELTGIRYAY